MQVRHPLERLLSSYLFLFVESGVHLTLTKKVKNTFMQIPKNKFVPVEGEEAKDSSGKETLTFRQFVNFLTKCPEEVAECQVKDSKKLMNRSFAATDWKTENTTD